MNCWNCGFKNEPDDEFCGNCGKYLKFSGTPTDDASAGVGSRAGQAADAGIAGATAAGAASAAGAGGAGGASSTSPGGGPTGGPTGADDPTTIYPRTDSGGSGAGVGLGSGGGQTGFVGRPPDIICWNCGRQNPQTRTFCINCGQRLTAPEGVGVGHAGTGAAGAAGAGGTYVGTRGRTRDDDGGGSGRTAAIILGALALLFIIGVIGALALGLFGSRPPGPIAVISPTPAGSAGVSVLPTFGTPGASASVSIPSVDITAPVLTLLPTIPPPPPPTRTPRPTCDAAGAPRGCRPSPTPEPATPTPVPTPVNCAASTAPTRSVTLTATDNTPFTTRNVPANRHWCVHDVTFTNTSVPGATGTLKLFIENQEFVGPPGQYGMAKIGWPGCEASIENNFGGGAEYSPTCEYPFGYETAGLPGGTIVSFEIPTCGNNGTCSGSVIVEFEPVIAPPPQ